MTGLLRDENYEVTFTGQLAYLWHTVQVY